MVSGWVKDDLLPVDDLVAVQLLESQHDLGGVELGAGLVVWLLLLAELVLSGEQAEELAAGAVLEQEVQLLLVAEAGLELDEEGVADAGEDLLLGHDVVLLPLLDDVLLLEDLEGEQLLVLLAGHQAHLRVGAPPDQGVEMEVVHADLVHALTHFPYLNICICICKYNAYFIIPIYAASQHNLNWLLISYTNRMAEFYQYTKARKQFGKPCVFSDSKVMSTALPPFEPKKKDEGYVLRNPNFIELDNMTEYTFHTVNTLRVSTGDKGMFHREGGWPESIDPTEQQQYARFMKKVDKDQVFAAQVKTICEAAERCMLKNNQIDMYEEYFQNEESEHVVENISLKTQMLFKDPPGICKRSVSEISWQVESHTKIAASYAINRFQQTPAKMKTCSYVWDVNNPNEPDLTLNSPSPVTNISFNHKLTDIIGGGCSNGIVTIWDARKGKDPTAMSHIQKSHSDPVTHFQWQMTKSGQECVTVSTDGYAHFWDIRRLKEDRVESLTIKDINANGEEVVVGATALENSPETATKFVIGTEQGTIIVANKKAKNPVEINSRFGLENRHFGPICSITRNLQNPKIFMTMGDWSAKIWTDDLKTPLIKTKYHDSYISDGCFSPTRVGAFFLTRKDGWLDVWDYYYRQNEVAFSHKVSSAPLTSIKINYTGTGNQITGGKIAAVGDEDGTVTILELCESLYTMQKNERDIMGEIFQRENQKEKNLEALRRYQELDKKKVPKDLTALQKKFEEKKKQEIKKVEDRFEALLKEIKSGGDLSPVKREKEESPEKNGKEEEN